LLSFLISTIVGGDLYLNFAPIYIYSIKKAYPDYNIKIYSWDKLNKNIKEILKIINCEECIIEKDFVEFEKDIKVIKATRWLYEYEDIKNYDFIFTGDIDFFICYENINLLNHHLNFCNKYNLCYSNRVRRNTFRLTGLHFYKVNEYYSKCNDVIEEFRNKLKKRDYSIFRNEKSELINYNGDEELLYLIAARSGLDFPKNIQEKRLHHGIHLKRNYNPDLAAKEFELKEYTNQFIDSYENDEIFKEILNKISKETRKYIIDCYIKLKG
jgi:hypothetical protein